MCMRSTNRQVMLLIINSLEIFLLPCGGNIIPLRKKSLKWVEHFFYHKKQELLYLAIKCYYKGIYSHAFSLVPAFEYTGYDRILYFKEYLYLVEQCTEFCTEVFSNGIITDSSLYHLNILLCLLISHNGQNWGILRAWSLWHINDLK